MTESWNESFAAELVGACVIVGLTYHEPSGPRQVQVFGTVTEVVREVGIKLRLGGSRAGEDFRLPPELNAFHPAPPGEYRFHNSGDVVINPDYMATWEINSAP